MKGLVCVLGSAVVVVFDSSSVVFDRLSVNPVENVSTNARLGLSLISSDSETHAALRRLKAATFLYLIYCQSVPLICRLLFSLCTE